MIAIAPRTTWNCWNKGRKLPPQPLTASESRRLIESVGGVGLRPRNRALIVVLYRAGLRISEALSVYPQDLDEHHGVIRVRCGKGRRDRVVGLDPKAWQYVQRWLNVRRKRIHNLDGPVFCTRQGKPLTRQNVAQMLRRAASRAGIPKRVHPHGLRHTHAFELANEGTPLHVIQAQLGHSNASTTDRYIRHLAPQQVIETIAARAW